MSKTSILNVEKFYNIFLNKIANIKLLNINICDQFQALERFKLLPFRMRLLYRSNIFCYKILNNQILSSFFNDIKFNDLSKFSDGDIVYVPFERSSTGCLRLSIWFPIFINKVLTFAFRLDLRHFKRFLIDNLKNLFFNFKNSLYEYFFLF